MKNLYSTNRPFSIITVLFIILCFIGGLWGVKGSGTFSIFGFMFLGGYFILIYSLIFIAMALLFFYFPSNGFNKREVLTILSLSVIARVLIFFQEPSDDIYRYIWEGFVFNNGFNPFTIQPNHNLLLKLSESFKHHSLINHPGIPAGYPPLVILIFSAIAKFSISVSFSKIVVTLFDFGSIFFLIEILKKRSISVRWVVLYALNPLVLYSFAGGGHIDSVQNFFLLWAVVCYDRRRWMWMYIFAGLAIQVKFVAVIAVPYLIRRENYRYLPVIFLPVILPYIPFIEGDPLILFKGISKFFREFAFNGPIHMIIRSLSGDMRISTSVTKTLFILIYTLGTAKIITSKRDTDPVTGILFAFASLLLLTPTLHIWYICWILPFALVRGVTSWVVLTLTASFYYTTLSVVWFGNSWSMPEWAKIIEWVPFLLFFSFELYYLIIRLLKDEDNNSQTDTISVVIPVLNEEKKIVDCIENLKRAREIDEIIVVDGGSSDKTVQESERVGAITLINSSPFEKGGGRGGQIKTGINASKSDIIAILHSDSLVGKNTFSDVKKVLEFNPDVVGGAVGSKFNNSFKMSFVEFLNGVRAVFFGISFGDQIQFFRREVVVRDNLFPDIPLMEDVEFSLRLPKYGRTTFLFGDAIVSTRRWKRKGIRNFFQVLVLFAGYLIRRPFMVPDTVDMYKKYYGGNL